MTEPRTPRLVRVTRYGAIAAEMLSIDGECEVVAAFERSCYVACPRGIVCIGTSAIGAGPINVELGVELPREWAALDMAVGLKGTISEGQPHFTSGLRLVVAGAAEWLPQPFPPFEDGPVRAGLATLKLLTRQRIPADGLARLVLAGDRAGATARAAAGSITELRRALPAAVTAGRLDDALKRAAILLVGLGPGLTPSGDDLIGGIMLALTAAGLPTLRDGLWHAIEPELDALTVPISAMHLSAAADGMAAEALHELLDAIVRGDDALIEPRLAAVGTIGHTSGWDGLAGMVIGLEAVLSPQSLSS